MTLLVPTSIRPIEYPDSDGKPMSDNTLQFRWIQTIHGNLAANYRDRDDVFVAGDLLWYAAEGHSEVCVAPDVLVVFGRPKGDRGSYKQWEEGGIPVTVAWEILSPSNTVPEMDDKLAFYEEHGVEEYYVYDPNHHRLMAYKRQGEVLRRSRPVEGYVSPRLGIRFDLSEAELVIFGPDGKRFLTFEELQAERLAAEQRAAHAEQRADRAEQRAARQAELMRRVLNQQATPDELQELQQLLALPSAPAP